MNDNAETPNADDVDWSELGKQRKEEMNWKMAHSILLMAFDSLSNKLERGEQPDPDDYMTPMSIAISCMNDDYPPQELCNMMSALAAVMRLKKELAEQASEQDETQSKH